MLENKQKTIDNLIYEFYPYVKEKLQFNEDISSYELLEDEENAQNPLGKTAYYEPSTKKIGLYITNRHPKDILRSFAHELIHHNQNCNNQLNNLKTGEGYAQNNTIGRKAEKDAYLNGNIIFRDWEDSKKGAIQKLQETRNKKITQKLNEVFGYKQKDI